MSALPYPNAICPALSSVEAGMNIKKPCNPLIFNCGGYVLWHQCHPNSSIS
jgi:hypothetical protein